MFKKKYVIGALAFLAGCTSPQEKSNSAKTPVTTSAVEDPTESFFIHRDSAAKMTSSYVASYGSQLPDTLLSWSVNADALRQYLSDTNIKEVKITLGHTLPYINSGKFGVPAGFSATALTIVVTGINVAGQTIYYNSNYALNRAKPCPPICF